MPSVRRTSSPAPGTWTTPCGSLQHLDGYLDRAQVDESAGRPRAIVVPHAGLMYSGPVAAFAYNVSRRHQHSATYWSAPLALLVPFRGVSIWPDGSWDTPLGPVTVDGELATAIAPEWPHIVDLPAAHGREHSLECSCRSSRTCFLACRSCRWSWATRRARPRSPSVPPLARGSPSATDVLLVASSDLSHYEDALTAAWLDRVVTQKVESLDPDGLMQAIEAEPRHACGGGPMVAVIDAPARRLGATLVTSATMRTPATCQATSRQSSAIWLLLFGDA